eukprot:TRINITY_DN7995_c0_g1_i1.p1 TRINITY_DN7995_c0_g1~~TRINITY_DN7995_c0_g1_i1.p1  ORF type:complete len:488 (-),score=87.87 TRINITY_DN7995_c0_g1_i1:21-1463(-)
MARVFYLDNAQHVTIEKLKDIGVQLFKFDVSDYASNPSYTALIKEHSLNFSDILITDNKDPQYKEKMKNFFEEHMHKEDEVRFFLSGGGYYDVRDKSDRRWIRIHGVAGDLIVLPAGIYHRFSNDEQDYAKILRLFVTSATWRPLNRSPSVDNLEERKKYLNTYNITITPPTVNAYILDMPYKKVSTDYLISIGVEFWKLDVTNYETKLEEIRKDRGYNYHDIVLTDPEHLPNYEEKIKIFFEEHIHKDEEVRFFLEGSGYFDVRGHEDEWIRIHAVAGDLLVLPAGIYHRFSNDENRYAKVMRLFAGSPTWTPYNRSDSDTAKITERTQFEQSLEGKKTPYNGLTNIVCHNPDEFDKLIETISKKNENEQIDCPIIMYFTAAENTQTKQLWCPDARKAQPLVEEALCKTLNNTTKQICFIKFPIRQEDYKGNPEYYFRLHPIVKLTRIPTMALFKNGNLEKRLIEGELHSLETILDFLK